MAASRRASARLSIVAVITAALGAAVAMTALRMMRLRRRLADVHGREVERLSTAALRDSLTGLRNHRSFHEDLRLAIAERRARHLLLVDLDGLKATNDAFGHKAGDELLVKLAGTLDAVATAYAATAYRIGGDEFAMLVTQDVDVDRSGPRSTPRCERSGSAVARRDHRRVHLGEPGWGRGAASPGRPGADHRQARTRRNSAVCGPPRDPLEHGRRRARRTAGRARHARGDRGRVPADLRSAHRGRSSATRLSPGSPSTPPARRRNGSISPGGTGSPSSSRRRPCAPRCASPTGPEGASVSLNISPEVHARGP